MTNSQNVVVCIMPQDTYDLISETLAADARSKAFDFNLREEIGEAQRTLASGMTTMAIPVESLPNSLLSDTFTAVYMNLLAGIVNRDGLDWKMEAVEAIKCSAAETLRSYYGVNVPQNAKDMLLVEVSSIKSEEELKNKGFVQKGPITTWDVYKGVTEWENEDNIKVLTGDFGGEFFYLGEKTPELLREIVDDNRLCRLLREAEIVMPEGNDEANITRYTWVPFADATKELLAENPQLHVFNVLYDSGNYRIVQGTHRTDGCTGLGYIIARNRVDLGGPDGILIRTDSSYPLQNKVITRK
ncbi:hypothetical protein [Paenibacillus gansuensis]|uniref:Uncharacterized protein n=1 Tax=Paenibacillus gansuensis TaxID=306542 RepID=A0ABW5PJX0_9BACL